MKSRSVLNRKFCWLTVAAVSLACSSPEERRPEIDVAHDESHEQELVKNQYVRVIETTDDVAGNPTTAIVEVLPTVVGEHISEICSLQWDNLEKVGTAEEIEALSPVELSFVRLCKGRLLVEMSTWRAEPMTLQQTVSFPERGVPNQTAATRAAIASEALQLNYSDQQVPSSCPHPSDVRIEGLSPEYWMAITFVEARRLLDEASELAVEATIAAADSRRNNPSASSAKQDAYSGPILSRAAAAQLLVGGKDGIAQDYVCESERLSVGAFEALGVLRSSGVSPVAVLDETLSIENLLVGAATVEGSVKTRLETLMVTQMGLTLAEFLDVMGLELEAFRAARQYLSSEIVAFGRSTDAYWDHAVDEDTSVKMYAATSRKPLPRHPEFYAVRARNDENSIDNEDTRSYSAQVGRLHHRMHISLDRLLSDTSACSNGAGDLSQAINVLSLGLDAEDETVSFHNYLTEDGASHIIYVQSWIPHDYGAHLTSDLSVVSGLEGLECASTGKVEGIDCDLDDYLVSFSWGSLWGTSQADIKHSRKYNAAVATLPVPADESQLFFIRKAREAASPVAGEVEVLFGFDPRHTINDKAVFSGLNDRVARLLELDPDDCANARVSCAGVSLDERLPLEDELSDDNDGVEDSWQHYLQLARDAANESDRLATEYVNNGIEWDGRLENLELQDHQREQIARGKSIAAVERLQDICGTEVDPLVLLQLLRGPSDELNFVGPESTCDEMNSCEAGFDCVVGRCTANIEALIEANRELEPDLVRLQSCLAESEGNFVHLGPQRSKEAVCVWHEAGNPNQMCLGNTAAMPCPALAVVSNHENATAECGEQMEHPSGTEVVGVTTGLDLIDPDEFGIDDPETLGAEVCGAIRDLRQNEGDMLKLNRLARSGYFTREGMEAAAQLISLRNSVDTGTSIYVGGRKRYAATYLSQVRQPGAFDGWPCDSLELSNCPAAGTGEQPHQDDWPLHCVDYVDCSSVEDRGRIGERMKNAVFSTGLLAVRPNQEHVLPVTIAEQAYYDSGSAGQWVSWGRGNTNGNPFYPTYLNGGWANQAAIPGPVTYEPGLHFRFQREHVPYTVGYRMADWEGGHPSATLNYVLGELDLLPAQMPSDYYPSNQDLRNWTFDGDVFMGFGSLPFNFERFAIRDLSRNDRWAYFWEGIDDPRGVAEGRKHGLIPRLLAGLAGNNEFSREYSFDKPLYRFKGTDEQLLDGLELLCEARSEDFLEDCDDVPRADSIRDLGNIEEYLACAAGRIRQVTRNVVLSEFPQEGFDAARKNSLVGAFPSSGGETAANISDLRVALIGLRESPRRIASLMLELKDQLASIRHAAENADNASALLDVELDSSIRNQLTACKVARSPTLSVSGGVSSSGFSAGASVSHNPGAAAATCANSTAQIKFSRQINRLRQQDVDNEMTTAFETFSNRTETISLEMQKNADQFIADVEMVDRQLALVELSKSKARRALANAMSTDSWESQFETMVNAGFEARNQTTKRRYIAAHQRAQRMAFLAKRAIEMRLGQSLADMTQPLPLVDAPATWESSMCATSPVDYQQVNNGQVVDFSDAFIGDYVTKLSNVVESYRLTNNFHQGQDQIVLSLRDSILGVRETCARDSRNLLYQSGALDAARWQQFGCEVDAEGVNLPHCIDVSEPAASVPELGEGGSFTLTFGDDVACPGDECGYSLNPVVEGTNGSVLAQTATLEAGEYRFSWYSPGEGLGLGFVESTEATVEAGVLVSGDPTSWNRYSIGFTLDEDATVLVGFQRGTNDSDVVAAPMLELLGPTDDLSADPRKYENTGSSRLVDSPTCEDSDGSKFRDSYWNRGYDVLCPAGFGAECDEGEGTVEHFIETSFSVSQDALQRGVLFNDAGFAKGNFNYRIEDLALNFVGTGLRACEESELPTNCYSSGFVSYSLMHEGPFLVRNHAGQDYEAYLFPGRIEFARGLAAERFLTNPISGEDENLLGTYRRSEFQGRPLDGNFVLRIWESEEFDFDSLEDIQLVMRYRYWTRNQ